MRLFNPLSGFKKFAFDILFPSVCLGCAEDINDDKYLCDLCRDKIFINSAFFCPVCRLRLADNKIICNHTNFPRYILGAATDYHDPTINNLIHCFKYEGFEKIAPLLSEFLIEFLDSAGFSTENFIMIPIPLHSSREKQRGYNQSKLLAEILSDKLNLELIDGLKRVKKTEPQAKAKKFQDREKNVSGCFTVLNQNQIENKNILLVDDVFTSGATMNEAVKVLRNAGVRKIAALVIARA